MANRRLVTATLLGVGGICACYIGAVRWLYNNKKKNDQSSRVAPRLVLRTIETRNDGAHNAFPNWNRNHSSTKRTDRYLEDNNNNNDDDNNNNANGDDDGDDFFGDDFGLQDDFVADDAQDSRYSYDDFYVYETDRTPKLFPIQTKTIFGFFICSLALTLGASSGTGGGGILVPIYILIVNLPIQAAIPIGACTVLGGSMASTAMNWTRRHPLADRVLIDWDLLLLLEPLTLAGTLVGALFHRMLSEKLLVVLLVLLLSITAHTTLSKATRMYQAEVRYIRSHFQREGSLRQTSTWGTTETEALHRQALAQVEKEEILILNPDYVTLRSELIQQEKFTPRSKIFAVVANLSILTFLNIMVGGGAYQSPWDIRCGSVAFWTIHVVMIVFLVASAWAAQTYVVARHEIKELVRFDYVHGDIKWNARSAILYPAVFVTAGFFAGTLGIGGGVITVPIMLAMGVHPSVVSATSSAMVMFTSFASTTSFFVFGLILPDFAIAAFFLGLIATFIGQLIMRELRQAQSASGRPFERNSYTAFAIGGVVLVSAFLMTIEYVFAIVEQPDYDDNLGGLCSGLRF